VVLRRWVGTAWVTFGGFGGGAVFAPRSGRSSRWDVNDLGLLVLELLVRLADYLNNRLTESRCLSLAQLNYSVSKPPVCRCPWFIA